MSILLRISAVLSLLWAIGLFLPPSVTVAEFGATPVTAALANSLAIANFGFAYLFWRAAANPAGERGVIYTALMVFGLRAANATYEVLYRLEGGAAILSLVDLVASLALFVVMLNTLPSTLRAADAAGSGKSGC